ncbi:MAG: AMP-binding protein [Actinoallomurus sp.]
MHLGQIAASMPDKPAVIMAGSGEVITFRELDEESNRLARLLRAEGLRPGDHIAFMLENHRSYLAIAWAAQRSGLYYTAISSRLKAAELSYIIGNCGARVFISSARLAGVATAVTADTRAVELRLMLDGTAPGFVSYEERIARHPATPVEDECEGVDMLYSSGTTGRPKGVKLALSLAPMGTLYKRDELVATLFPPDGDSVYLSPAPLYHAAPLRYSLTYQRFGATVIVMERFDAEEALRVIERYRVTHSQWVPTMFIRMLKLPDETRAAYDLSSLRYAVHASAPCPVDVKERMIGWWGPVLHEYYAGTEGNGVTYTDSPTWLEHKGTVGRPLLGEVHVCDEEGVELPPGRTGVLYFAGGPDFDYHDDQAKTESARDPLGRGWTTLGDVGYVDEDGFVYLTDRLSYMIISGGVNIYPQEAENVLAVHPKVADVAVFGVPDAEMGESVKAVVQPVDPAGAGPELERELIDHCRERLAHYKCPLSIDFRADLPRHPTGKLYKRLLKDEYAAGGRPAGGAPADEASAGG